MKKYPLFKILTFLKSNLVWWLSPVALIIVLFGLLVFLGRSSQSVPFAYTPY